MPMSKVSSWEAITLDLIRRTEEDIEATREFYERKKLRVINKHNRKIVALAKQFVPIL